MEVEAVLSILYWRFSFHYHETPTLIYYDKSPMQNFSVGHLEAGPVFECVRFSIYGRSPLLQHYLYHHNLTDTQKPTGLAISRTQVKEIPEHSITYKQVVKGQGKKAKKLYQEYQEYVESQMK